MGAARARESSLSLGPVLTGSAVVLPTGRHSWRAARQSPMRPGDVIAFRGTSMISRLFAARTNVSHVAIVAGNAPDLLLAEATVQLSGDMKTIWALSSPLKQRIADYDGTVKWLPLADRVCERFDRRGFDSFLNRALGRPFGFSRGALVVMGEWRRRAFPARPFVRWAPACSCFVSQALIAAGVISPGRRLMSPADVCRLPIYSTEVKIK